MMTCRETELLTQRYLDREITTAQFHALQEHLLTCPRCLEGWLATLKTMDLISALPQDDCPAALHASIMMQLPIRRRQFRFFQEAAAVLLVGAAMAGVGFYAASRQLAAAVVENRDGRSVVVPKPGRRFVIPPGAVVNGDLHVQGDVHLQGRIAGRIEASGRVVRNNAREPWRRLVEALGHIWRILTGS